MATGCCWLSQCGSPKLLIGSRQCIGCGCLRLRGNAEFIRFFLLVDQLRDGSCGGVRAHHIGRR
jgi:hypothetical protein